ncbi:rhodanese-like domain-containing protein [Desulfurispira natronophila]|uniref:Rhodanese-related sulfurtransferase n=1 Tax=Desulfurispira natronophila TaxID=682562 RepID=A0A7W8DH92_9BACT|nr:rhodanese-like domain-containing protein [Desulfurispira natronophila]MBB5022321.1 rhodanese-related sulfurtransferase [Desulfurispira natronophila]
MNSVFKVLVLLTLLVFGSGVALSQMGGIPNLSAKELQERLEEPDVLVVDTRSPQEYYRGHIPGAINITSQQTRMFHNIARYLPQDRNMTLVFYCRGETCTLAPDAAVAAMRSGYQNAYTYSGGFPDWEQQGLPVERP